MPVNTPVRMPVKFTVSTDIDPRSDKHGKHGIYIRVTSKGRRIRFHSGHSCLMRDWSGGKLKPLTHPINMILRSQIAALEAWILKEQPGSLAEIKGRYGKANDLTLSGYMKQILPSLSTLGIGTRKNHSYEIDRIEKFDRYVHLSEINNAWLRKYEHHLSETMATNTVHKCFKILARYLNMAVKDGLIERSPLMQYDRPKYRQSNRTYLTSEEVEKVEAVLLKPLPDYLYRAASYFLLGCYSGLRVSDWIRFHPSWIDKGRLQLRAKKNGEIISMKIHTRLQVAIDRVLRIGPCDTDQKTNEYLKAVGKLAGLDKVLTTHVGRHSFAVRCAELGISVESTAELMGIAVRTCGYYYKVTGRKLDVEMDKWG